MTSRDDRVTVTTPAGTEATVSRTAWEHTYRYRGGWKLVTPKPSRKRTTRRKKAD